MLISTDQKTFYQNETIDYQKPSLTYYKRMCSLFSCFVCRSSCCRKREEKQDQIPTRFQSISEIIKKKEINAMNPFTSHVSN